MTQYFKYEESINYRLGDDISGTIERISNMYIGQNPALPFVFKCFSRQGIRQLEDGRYDINLLQKFPESKQDQYAYVMGMVWSDYDRWMETALSCYGPTKIYLNGKLLFKSGVVEDVNINNRKVLSVNLIKGWNVFLISMRKVASGFGCIFGSNRSSLNLMEFMSPFSDRSGHAGWIYSELINREIFNESNMPDYFGEEACTGLRWYPETDWTQEKAKKRQMERVFNIQPGKVAYAWTKLDFDVYSTKSCSLRGSTEGATVLWIDGVKVYEEDCAGMIDVSCELKYGYHEILIESVSGMKSWGFTLNAYSDGRECKFIKPCPVKGTDDPWFLLGPFNERLACDPGEIQNLYKLFHNGGEDIYWRIDRPDTWLRPFVENPLFARWTYPLGVTLYGLLQSGRILKRKDIIDYVISHLTECTRMYRYSVWDVKQYGYPSINQKLIELKMLDDCGSMGAVLLEACKDLGDESCLQVADVIADYMENRQERREDGAFYRLCKGYFMENTLWADDLYMSTPFLIRYYKITGKQKYLDDAVRQFLLFKKYLFMPEQKIMAHVYDFKYGTATGIPWGRGNGWPLFSLSEILEVMPEEHPRKQMLLEFFNEFSRGVLALQGDNGLWHQVLTWQDSYEETSCTAMFTYSFARGIRFGWLQDRDRYIKAVCKAWKGLTCKLIDRQGNIHGVCCGSRYSFTTEYYKDELPYCTNDAHGIGIVLLAGIETSKLMEFLKENN